MQNTAVDSLKNRSKRCSRYVRVANSDVHQIKWASPLVAVPNDLPLPPASFFLTRAVFVSVWFLVVRPEATSSTQPSSGTYGRLTRYKP